MRICMLLVEEYPPDIRITKEARALSEAGHDVFVLSNAFDDRPGREIIDGVEVIRRPFDEVFEGVSGVQARIRRLTRNVHVGWKQATAEIVETESIDVLHAHDLPIVETALAVGRDYGLPVVADLHENMPEAKRQYRMSDDWQDLSDPVHVASRVLNPIWRWKQLERRAVHNADLVITVVEEAREHYIKECGASPEKVSVVSNVVDLNAFDSAPIEPVGFDDEFVITYLGSLSGRHRGLGAVVEAMPEIADRIPTARLLIVGSGGSYERTLRRRCSTLDVQSRVTFTGWVDFEKVPSYLAVSDIGLVPHRSTGHTETTVPHKLFQYMAMRTPVLVTDVGPLRRIVNETNAGVIVPPDHPSAIANAVVDLYEHPERRQELGENGRAAVEARYNWDVESETLCELYRDLTPVHA